MFFTHFESGYLTSYNILLMLMMEENSKAKRKKPRQPLYGDEEFTELLKMVREQRLLKSTPRQASHYRAPGGGGGDNAIFVPYRDVPPIRVYLLAFESETGCLSSSQTLKQGAKFVRSFRARVPIHSTVWPPPPWFLLICLLSRKLILVLMS